MEKVVSVFGCYKYGNFGDDLMGCIFARSLVNKGYNVKVYGLVPEVAAEMGISRAANVDELLSDSCCVVYGGGGVFLSGDSPADSVRGELEQDILKLVEGCESKNIPLFMFSVGGDAANLDQIPAARKRLLKRAEFITFRNPEEASLIALARGQTQVIPDIVWATRSVFGPMQPGRKLKLRVGVDRSTMDNYLKKLFVALLRIAGWVSPTRFQVVVVDQRFTSDESISRNTIRYSGLRKFIGEIASLDLIITHRLHLGMTAMSYGVPVIQLYPSAKAELVFARVGLSDLCLNSSLKCAKFLLRQIHPMWLRQIQAMFEKRTSVRYESEAMAHIAAMERCVTKTLGAQLS